MKKLTKNILSGLLSILAIIVIFGYLVTQNNGNVSKVALSEIVQDIKNDNISSIIVSRNTIKATLKDEKTVKQAEKEPSGTFIESLQAYGVSEEKIKDLKIEVQNNEGSSLALSVFLNLFFPILLIGGLLWFSIKQAQKGNSQAMMFGRSMAKVIMPDKDRKKMITFDDVAGLKEAKEELEEIVEFLKNPQKYTDIGAKIPKGVLLVGPPGTGKTLLARAVANEAEVPFFFTSGSEFVEMFVGVGASRIRDLFKTAEKNSPALIFIDELDAVGRSRGTGVGGGNDEREQTLNQILVEMDGFEANKGLIVLAATNRPDVLDSALMRPGRFDRRVTLDLPDIKEREQILKVHAKGKPMDKKVNLRKIAERTPGFSGADLSNLLNEAAILSARNNKKTVSEDNILMSIDKVLMGPERKSRVISEKEKKIVAYHEAGHAITGHFLEQSDPIQKVTIIPRGRAGGYTLKMPTEDRRLVSRSHFEADMAVALGGYIAEEMIFGEMTTGASNDIQQLTQIAEQYVRYYGMSQLGPIHYSDYRNNRTGEITNHSEKTLQEIDAAVKAIIDKAYNTCKQTLTDNRDKLELLAQALIEHETIERTEFEALMNGEKTDVDANVKDNMTEEKI
ncbi:MAG: cell division protein FtsH, cell division protease FtsH [Candidatus Parcubacteria bacterium]|jgi:cell division protease FtsH